MLQRAGKQMGTIVSEESFLRIRLTELASKEIIPDVQAARLRAKDKGIAFTKIVNPDAVIRAGLENFTSDFGLIVVSPEVYVRFIHSFVKPPDK